MKFLFFATGVGNYNTILNLTKFLEHNEVDFVVNIGVCGYKEGLSDDFYRGYQVTTKATNKENKDGAFGNLLSSSSDILPLFIQVARIFNLANRKELIIPQVLEFGRLESIVTSEKPVFDEKDLTQFSTKTSPNPLLLEEVKIRDEATREKFVDMESYGFEMVCDSFSLPRIILKVPVDKIGIETKNFDYKKALNKLKENIPYEKLVRKIAEYFEGVEEKVDFEKYFKCFSFTFSEKEIFKKLYFKLKVKSGKLKESCIDKLLENGKKLGKNESKEFLKNLQNSVGYKL